MEQIVGVQLGCNGRIVPCRQLDDQNNCEMVNCAVIAELEQGAFFGRVVWQRQMQEDELERYLQSTLFHEPVQEEDGPCKAAPDGQSSNQTLAQIRLASPEEEARGEQDRALCREAKTFCQACAHRLELDMKLVEVEMLYDHSKMLFYFTAPTRIDFRDLVKELVRKYRTRIELRQIGVRHETQMVGALGNCGMVCCCRRYLRSFAPVTIKMAKEQNLFLNPAKISGVCGRLLCCLSFEQDNYDSFHHNCPKMGKRYQTSKGLVRILRGNMFRNSVVVLPDNGQEVELTLEEWRDLQPRRADASNPQNPPQAPKSASNQREKPSADNQTKADE